MPQDILCICEQTVCEQPERSWQAESFGRMLFEVSIGFFGLYKAGQGHIFRWLNAT
jgi:hypothetical protein